MERPAPFDVLFVTRATLRSSLHRAPQLILGMLLIYALLVGTHRGEFWPFTIYPMFSQAGQSWARTLVRSIHVAQADSLAMRSVDLADLPGKALALEQHGISHNGLSAYILRSQNWTQQRQEKLIQIFREVDVQHTTPEQALMIYRVEGHMDTRKQVQIRCIPFAYVYKNKLVFNPIYPEPIRIEPASATLGFAP